MIKSYLKNATDYWEVDTAGTLHMIWFEPKVALKIKGSKGLTDIEMTPEEAEKMAEELLKYSKIIRETKEKLLNEKRNKETA
jgi:hypothetical protein